ncbi:MAG: signal peptidase I [Actinomycetaceae bacterium]|nr:signal peptidase I [Actinomycetaceae bacterium]
MPSKEADRTIRRRTRRVRGSRFFEWTMIIVLALALSSFVRAFLMQAFWIPSSSMEETLQIGDNVVVSRLTPRFFDIERGDVVVFRDAEGWLPPPEEKRGVSKVVDRALTFTGLRPASGEQHLVKRVIGVGGDTVSCCDPEGKIQVNGVPISEPYLAPGADNTRIPFEVTVPEGHLWVMGDNRNRSADSRVHLEDAPSAFINQDDVVGRVFWITWPVNHWGNPTSNDPFDAVK